VKKQISREPYEFPTLELCKKFSSIDDLENLTPADIKINNYRYHDAIKADMAV